MLMHFSQFMPKSIHVYILFPSYSLPIYIKVRFFIFAPLQHSYFLIYPSRQKYYYNFDTLTIRYNPSNSEILIISSDGGAMIHQNL